MVAFFPIMLLNRDHCSDYFLIFTQTITVGGSVDGVALQSLKMVLILRHNSLSLASVFSHL